MNEGYIKKAFTPEELECGVWNNWDGRGNILTKRLINIIKDKLDFSQVKCILDIGSRDGLQSMEFNRWFPEAKIYAFEPIKSSFNFIVNLTKDIDNIEALNYAITSYNGKIKFYEVYNGNVGASSLLKTSGHPRTQHWQQREIEVDCINLEDWLDKKEINSVDIAWVDVQGAEKIVFESFGKYLNDVKVIATEVGVVPLYEGAITKELLDKQLTNHICISSQLEPSGTESDTIYIRRDLL